MISAVPVARLGGVEIRAHWSWIVVLALIMVSLMFDYSDAYPNQGFVLIFGGALGTSLLIFLSVVVHELAHVVLARRAGLGGNVVTVHLLGGTFVLELQPRNPGEEFRIAVVGPIVSFALSIFFGFVAAVPTDGNMNRLFWPAVILSSFNLLVALVNLVPGYPMDGARIIRSVIWRARGQEVAATAAAGRAGRYTGYSLVAVGFVLFVLGDSPTALMAIIGGWVLAGAGASVERREALRRVMSGLLVRDAIEREPGRVPPQLTLDTFAADLLAERGRAVLVTRGREVLGVIGAAQAARIGARNWGKRHARDVMTPLDKVPVVQATDELWPTLELLERLRIDAVVVSGDGADAVATVDAAQEDGVGTGVAPAAGGVGESDSGTVGGAAAPALPGDAVGDAGADIPMPSGMDGAPDADDDGEEAAAAVTLLTARSAARAVTARAQERLVAPWLSSARLPGRGGRGGRGTGDAGAPGVANDTGTGGAAESGAAAGGDAAAPSGDAAAPSGDAAAPDGPSENRRLVPTSRNEGPAPSAPAERSREDGLTGRQDGAPPDGGPHEDDGPQPGSPPG